MKTTDSEKKTVGKTVRLYDFTPWWAFLCLAAYALLLLLFGYTFLTSEKPLLYGIIWILLLLSLGFVLYYFLVRSIRLTDRGIERGDQYIERPHLNYTVRYDPRFKESVILFSDKRESVVEMDSKTFKKRTIRVQATKANLKKAGAYLGCELSAPEKPKNEHFFRGKNRR